MDYVIGSVAALISGNVTPNRPKLVRRALTPTKHQSSPNVTPKSEFVEDRSIFLSPTQQKKKAIVKKSPKRIFQNPDLDMTENCEGNSSVSSPKPEKVKKHLREELEANDIGKKKSKVSDNSDVTAGTPTKKKKKGNTEPNVAENRGIDVVNVRAISENSTISTTNQDNVKSPKRKPQKSGLAQSANTSNIQDTSIAEQNTKAKNSSVNNDSQNNQNQVKKNKKPKKKNKKSQLNNTATSEAVNAESATVPEENLSNKNKKKKRKNKQAKIAEASSNTGTQSQESEKMNIENHEQEDNELESESEEVKSRNIPNPNAITEKDSDSEHESDDDIESENEQANEKVLTNDDKALESSDEEEKVEKTSKKKEKKKDEAGQEVMSEEEIKRTLFVGNVPFSSKCKKEIKKIFSKYGQIDTIRIRTIPVKDARITPKLAIIKNELHPERTTVNVYIKYAEPSSVGKAIAANNTVLNGNHLRVSRSDSTGAEHDPRCAVFVGNLPFGIEDDTLRSKFENCGQITSVRVIRDKKTNAGKGFGYVNFTSKDGVELALALSEEDLTIKNRILRVKRCSQAQGGNKGGKLGEKKWEGKQGGKWGGQQGGRGFQGGGTFNNQGDRRVGSQDGGKFGRQGGGKWGNQGGGKFGSQAGGNWGAQGPDGAARRMMNKRKFQETSGGEGPPNKQQRVLNQPGKEKKQRKEFVGMTSEKKKKQKFNKGLKKKKALSEILTKKM